MAPLREPHGVDVEVWDYPPSLFARAEVVDQLSLYLSLKPRADERVQAALEHRRGSRSSSSSDWPGAERVSARRKLTRPEKELSAIIFDPLHQTILVTPVRTRPGVPPPHFGVRPAALCCRGGGSDRPRQPTGLLSTAVLPCSA